MKLTDAEVKQIDVALAALKRSLKDELDVAAIPGQYNAKMDDAFLSKISDNYLSARGIVSLLADAHFLTSDKKTACGGVCHCSCAQPSKGYETF